MAVIRGLILLARLRPQASSTLPMPLTPAQRFSGDGFKFYEAKYKAKTS